MPITIEFSLSMRIVRNVRCVYEYYVCALKAYRSCERCVGCKQQRLPVWSLSSRRDSSKRRNRTNSYVLSRDRDVRYRLSTGYRCSATMFTNDTRIFHRHETLQPTRCSFAKRVFKASFIVSIDRFARFGNIYNARDTLGVLTVPLKMKIIEDCNRKRSLRNCFRIKILFFSILKASSRMTLENDFL